MADQGQHIELFLEVLRFILPSLKLHTDAQLSKRIGKEKTEEAALDLAGFIESGSNRPLLRNERKALSEKVMMCLANYVKNQINLPISLNTIINHMGILAHAVDASFPGYAESKLLRYTVVSLETTEQIPVRR